MHVFLTRCCFMVCHFFFNSNVPSLLLFLGPLREAMKDKRLQLQDLVPKDVDTEPCQTLKVCSGRVKGALSIQQPSAEKALCQKPPFMYYLRRSFFFLSTIASSQWNSAENRSQSHLCSWGGVLRVGFPGAAALPPFPAVASFSERSSKLIFHGVHLKLDS